jgi:hypothetical protein
MSKKTLFVFSTHSFVDLITNSSTELFVCDTKKTLDATKELLALLLKHHDEIEGTTHTFDDVFGTIALSKFKLDWYDLPESVRDAHEYYNEYSSFGQSIYTGYTTHERNPERQELQEQDRAIHQKHNVWEKDLDERDRAEYDRRWKACREDCDALWTDYGARTLTAEKNFFIEFLKQNEFSAELIEQAALVYDAEIERHTREKKGQYPWFKAEFSQPELAEAHEVFREFKSWGITANKGDIFVYSSSDNTIPYDMFGTIESYLNADRYHLG